MQKIRTFIAVKISPEVEKVLDSLMGEMRRMPASVKWVKPQSIHITLKFLGEITREELEKVFAGVQTAVGEYPSFTLKTADGGAFPSLERPKVFWVGLDPRGKERLIPLQQAIEASLASRGFSREKRSFSPHLTVGRVKGSLHLREISQHFSAYSFPTIEFPVDEVLVMKSQLTPGGAVYTVQKAFPLKNN